MGAFREDARAGTDALLGEGLLQVIQSSKSNLEKIEYFLASYELPLYFAFVFASILAVLDNMMNPFPSPLIIGPVVVSVIFLLAKKRVSLNWRTKGVRISYWTISEEGIIKSLTAMSPLVYALVAEYILDFRTPMSTKALIYLPPAFMAVVCATDFTEAAVYLIAHIITVFPLFEPGAKVELCCLLCNNLILLLAAWMKSKLLILVRELLSQYATVDAYLLESSQTAHACARCAHPNAQAQQGAIRHGSEIARGTVENSDDARSGPQPQTVEMQKHGEAQSLPAQTNSEGWPARPTVMPPAPPTSWLTATPSFQSSADSTGSAAMTHYGGMTTATNAMPGWGTHYGIEHEQEPMLRLNIMARRLQEADRRSKHHEDHARVLTHQLAQQGDQIRELLGSLPPWVLQRLQYQTRFQAMTL